MISHVHIRNCGMGEASYSILEKSLCRYLRLRSVPLGEETGDCYTVSVSTDEALKNDRYRITCAENSAVILAANDCAVHAAVGRLLLESSFNGRGAFVPPEAGKTIDFTPAKPIRGMYFATHFYNFYHSAPIGEVFEVVEDLAMRGCNSILVWFDMHHFTGMDDPGARELAERLRAILKYANQIGISGSLTMLGNITVPAALLIIGSSMSQLPIRSLLGNTTVYLTTALRLALLPLAVYYLTSLMGFSPMVVNINTVVIAMPVATYGTILCLKYGKDTTLMAEVTFITTLLSMISIPLLTMLF